jgi:hypothetical protein
VLEVEGQRKKKGWRQKEQVTTAPLFISQGHGRGCGVVFHYPDSYCERRHMVAHQGAAVPVTVPLGNDGTQ